MRKLFIFLMAVLASGCSDIVECALNDPPNWENRELPDGMRFQSYYQTIQLNETSDFSIQDFRLTGNLPNGLDYVFYGDEVVISGTPTENGTFPFKLKVSVNYVDSEGNTESCSHTAQKNYAIKIN